MKQNIKEAALDYLSSHDGNFYAEDNNVSIYIGTRRVDVETIWRSILEDKVYLHVGCTEFEGDIDIESLSDENQAKMLEAFNINTCRKKMWDEVTNYVEMANEHLAQDGVKAQIHVEKHQTNERYTVYVLHEGNDVDIKKEDVKLKYVVENVEDVWRNLVDSQCDDADDYCETVQLRRLSGDTHQGESNLIYSFANCPLFFIHNSGYIEDVGNDINLFVGKNGYFAVNAEDYHEAMRQVYKHENGCDGN